ncbi:MAG: S8 family serine peptidase [Leptolyngbyaceae bacterium]|nr:S8 family serine peptidase [Leptolyngbyaceae bacterium]
MSTAFLESSLLNSSVELALSDSLAMMWDVLTTFSHQADVLEEMAIAFGPSLNPDTVDQLFTDITKSAANLPRFDIRPSLEINGAYGAFAAATNTIYLSEEFLVTNQNNIAVISDVLLEELGHFLDTQLNPTDSPGDEGAIFSDLVQDNPFTAAELDALYAEDDSVTVTLDGATVQLEQATPGINSAFDLIGLTQLRNDPRFSGIDGTGFAVAVIDTGLDRTHPLLSGNYVTGFDFVDNDNIPNDQNAHGTHVAGTVGSTDENIGVAPDVGLIGLKASGRDGFFSTYDLLDSLNWVLANHRQYNIVAVNMSLGGGFYTSAQQVAGDPLIDVVNQLELAGITIVSAAGNSYDYKEDVFGNLIENQRQNVGSPAIYSTLSVGAVWQDNNDFGSFTGQQVAGSDRLTVFSQRLNADNMIFAPGAMIKSTVPGGGFDQWPGTSMSSPHIAGIVALMQEAAVQFGGRTLTPDEIVEILRTTADTVFDGDDEEDFVRNTNISYPRVNVFRAVEEIFNRFQDLGGTTGDPNGTIQGALIGPRLDGAEVLSVTGSIGFDGGTVNVGNTDVDIVQFTVEAPGTVSIEVATDAASPDDFDSILRLFNQNGTQIASNDDKNANSTFSRLDVFLNPGTYYAGVSGYDNGAYNPTVAGSGVAGETGNYELRFSVNSPDPNGLLSGAVDVQLGTSREPLLFEGFIGADYGKPVGVSDVDLFKIVVPDNGTLLIDIDTPYETDYVDSFLRLFDENGNELFFEDGGLFESDDDLSFDRVGNATEFTDAQFPDLVFEDPVDRDFFDGHETDSFLGALVERGEVYYIGVSDYFNQDYNATNLNNRLDAGEGGLYDLIVEFVNNDLNGNIDQAVSDLSLPVTDQRGLIGSDGDPVTGDLLEVGDKDVDFFKIRPATAGILEIDIDSFDAASQLTFDTAFDSVVLVFDGDGNLVASNDDSASLDPFLQIQVSANTDYFVAVTGYGNDNFDPFALGSGSSGETGEYILKSSLQPSSSFGALTNDAIQTGAKIQAVNPGDEIIGNIGSDDNFVVGATDIDLYRFVPSGSGAVSVRTVTNLTASPEDSGADTFLRFFDAAGNELAFNDDESDTTRGSLVQATVVAGQEYYIGVNGYSDQARNYDPLTGTGAVAGSEGSYLLTVETDGKGIDGLIGGDGNDRLVGTDTNDQIVGNGGSDRLIGKDSNDKLMGGNGKDNLKGGDGKDRLDGGNGNDKLDGGKGNDLIFTGGGRDRVRIRKGQGFDQIKDFSSRDKIDLAGIKFNQLSLQQQRNDVIVQLGRENLLRIEDVDLASITRTDFV